MYENKYITIYKPHHPNSRKNGQIFEHRFIMAESLGRPLYDEEIVHHRNGLKFDNRSENVELTTKKAHMRHHRKYRPVIESKECFMPDCTAIEYIGGICAIHFFMLDLTFQSEFRRLLT